MRLKYNAFIFDFDGTLADSRLNIANSFNAALKINNYHPIPEIDIYPFIGKESLENHFLRFYSTIPRRLIPKLIADFQIHQLKYLKKELQLFPTVTEVLKILKQKDKSLAILTTKGTEQVTKMLGNLKILRYFKVIYGRDLPYGEKPDKKCVNYILSQLSVKHPEEAVIVGDTEIDALTAKNSGIDMIGVLYGIGTRKELEENGATHLITAFDQILRYA